MARYLMYTLDASGRISLPEEILAESDQQAIDKVRSMNLSFKKCEVWNERRMVAILDGA